MTRRAAAILQALFALGCLQLVVKLLRVSTSSAVALGLSAGLVVLAGLGLWAAVALWRGKPAGAVLTLVLQAVHLVYLETASLSIAISLPIAIVVGLDGGFHPHSWLAWKPSIEITVETLDQSPWIGVNLLALFSAGVAVFELRRALREAGVLGKAPAAL